MDVSAKASINNQFDDTVADRNSSNESLVARNPNKRKRQRLQHCKCKSAIWRSKKFVEGPEQLFYGKKQENSRTKQTSYRAFGGLSQNLMCQFCQRRYYGLSRMKIFWTIEQKFISHYLNSIRQKIVSSVLISNQKSEYQDLVKIMRDNYYKRKLKSEQRNVLCLNDLAVNSESLEISSLSNSLDALTSIFQRSIRIDYESSSLETVEISLHAPSSFPLTADDLFESLECLLKDDNFFDYQELTPPINRWILHEYSADKLIRNIKFKHNLAIFDEFTISLWNKHIFFSDLNDKIHSNWESYWELVQEDADFIQQFHLTSTEPNSIRFWTVENKNKFLRIPLLLHEIGCMLIDMCDDAKINEEVLNYLDPKTILYFIIRKEFVSCFDFMTNISKLIKKICAPFRDSLIDGITVESNDYGYLICFKKLVEFAELMRLDLLNEFIRRYKTRIILNVRFEEQRYFESKIDRILSDMRLFIRSLPDNIQQEQMGSLQRFISLTYLWISSQHEFSNPVPEHFLLDYSILVQLFNQIQDATIIMTLRALQCSYLKDKRPMSMAWKHSLKRLLAKEHTTIGQIISNYLTMLEQSFHHPLDLNEKYRISKIVDQVLRIKSPLFQLYHRRIVGQVENILLNSESTYSTYRTFNLVDVLDEIHEIATRIRKISRFHISIYESILYNKL